jgi:hypothetical protein
MTKKEKFRKTHKKLKKYVNSPKEKKTKKVKADCPEGQIRSEKGHCKNVKVEKEKKIKIEKEKKVKIEKEMKSKKIKEKKPCPEGQERIDDKGHCKKIQVEKEKKIKKNKTEKIKKNKTEKIKKISSKSGTKSNKSGSWSTAASSKLSNISDLISDTGDELNEEQRKEFDDIIKNLQEGKLKGMNLDSKGIKEKPNSKELSINCLKMFDDIALEKELDKRKKAKAEKEEEKKPAINILVPKKKVPKA